MADDPVARALARLEDAAAALMAEVVTCDALPETARWWHRETAAAVLPPLVDALATMRRLRSRA